MKNVKNSRLIKSLALAIVLLGFSFVAQAGEIDKNIIMQTNQERVKTGLRELRESELLNEAAKMKAQDMIANNYFSHTSPQNVEPWHWFEEVEYKYKYAGENLAMNFSTAISVHKAWMKSESHKDNMLSDHYSEIGVAVLDGILEGRQTKIAVQFFGFPLGGEQSNLVFQIDDSQTEKMIEIEEVSVKNWEGVSENEMIVYAKVSGQPSIVEVHFDGKTHELKNVGDNRYMNLITIEGTDLSSESIVIKAEMNEGKALFYQIPQDQYLASVKGIDTEDQQKKLQQEEIMGVQIEKGRLINSQNIALVLFMAACMIMVGNVWVLEKEEERLLLKCNS